VRVVHLTDLHFHAPLRASQLLGKRALGAANLVLRGRARQFGGASRGAVVDDVLGLAPALVVVTGDLTALATDAEFEAARRALQPLLDAYPVAVTAGNHDRYTRGSARARRMEDHFQRWMCGGTWDPADRTWRDGGGGADPGVVRFSVDGLDLWMVDTARPSAVSRGRVDRGQLDALSGELRRTTPGRRRLLGLHYPLLGADGKPYRNASHGLVGVDRLIEVIRQDPVDAVLHGHVHRWRAGAMAAVDGTPIPVFNGGSSGLAPGGHAEPGYLVLEFDGGGALEVTRRTWTGEDYRPEPVPIPEPSWPS